MSQSKRYTLINKHIRGGSVLPQNNHALTNLWKKYNQNTLNNKDLMDDWANNSEVEVVLQGGTHRNLEDLYSALSNLNLPCAKFNESDDDLCGACTAVTFVADRKIVALNNAIRINNVGYEDMESWILNNSYRYLVDGDGDATKDELSVLKVIAYSETLRL